MYSLDSFYFKNNGDGDVFCLAKANGKSLL